MVALFALLVGLAPLGSTLQAQGRPFDRSILKTQRPQLDGEYTLQAARGTAAQRSGPTKVIIELGDAPATQVYASGQSSSLLPQDVTAQVRTQLARIEQAQQALVQTLQSSAIGATVLYRTQRVYNGVAVQVSPAKLGQIRALPGVKAVHQLVTKKLENSTSVPFIGAPQLWADDLGPVNNRGDGIKIGIIDTGIDYLHTDFGGPGTGYDTNDTAEVEPGSFPTAKVVGGYDFVGDDYNADPNSPDYQPVPAPDEDPLDCNGHGSHVAGTAAGFGVNSNGTTYTGSYGPSTPFSSLRIGPGVAPRASLYALKVFGCEGSTDVTDAAIEWAVDPNADGDFSDHLDVINMSLGSEYGGAYDSSTVASDNAALADVVVVASAGNSGDTNYVTGSPGSSSRTISVASSVDNGIQFSGVRVNSPAGIAGTYVAALASFGPPLSATDLTGDLVYPATNRTACAPFAAGTFTGKIALVDRGGCEFATKVLNAQNAGAIAVIIVNNVSGTPITPGPGVDAPSVTIPSAMITLEDGATIKAAIAGGATVNVSLSSSIVVTRTDLADTLSDFSSRGPRRSDSFLKPDIAAPGQDITSAGAGTGNDSLTISGTSMAAPHIAGSMALLRQLHPDWSVEQLKALAMNTATEDLYNAPGQTGDRYGPGRIGAGRVFLPNARDSSSIAYVADNSGLVSVSFGAPEVVGTATASKSVRIENKGAGSETYAISYVPFVDMPGVAYTISRSNLTLAAGGFGDVTVTMTATASQMKRIADPTVAETQGGLPRDVLGEESGYLVIAPSDDAPQLRVPIHAVPRPASAMRAESSSLDFSEPTTLTDTIVLTGTGVATGNNFPTDTLSLVSAFELQHISPDNPNRPQVANADLEYVGVASDYAATGSVTNDTRIFFGLATHDLWQSPNVVEFDIYIDTNRDGTDDYVLFNWNLGSASGGDPTDVFVSVLVNLKTGSLLLEDYLNGLSPDLISTQLFNSRVMAIPVYAADLGLSGGSAAFDYRVYTYSRDNDIQDDDQTTEDESIVDSTPTLSWNAAESGVDASDEFAGLPAYADLPGEEVPVAFNATNYGRNNSLGVLLLHHQNTAERQAEIVTVQGALFNYSNRILLPLVLN